MKAPEMNGNIILINIPHIPMLHDFVVMAQIKQYSVNQIEDGSFILSTPVTKQFEDYATGMVHGARARQKDKEKSDPKPPTGGGDGTPPSGGTPGTPTIDRYTYTEARAA